MKKVVISILIATALIFLFSPVALADGISDGYIEDFRGILLDGQGEELTDTRSLMNAVSIEALLSEIISIARGEGSRVIAFLLALIGIGIISSLSASVGTKLAVATERAIGVVASIAVFSYLGEIFSSAESGILKISSFFSAAVPIYTAISVSSGAVSTASVQALGMNFTSALLGGAGISVMTAAVGMGVASALTSFMGDGRTEALSKSVHGFFKWLCGIATALIMATLSLQSIISTVSDSAVLRAARYAASGMIPMVGGTVSGALSTLAAGLAYAKGIVGAGSVALIVTLALSPLIILLLYRLALSLAISFVSFIGTPCIQKIYSSYKSALDSLCAVYALSACLCIFEIILFMKSGVVT